MFHFWRQVGKRMNIENIPEDYAEFERFNVQFEQEHYQFSEANRRVAEAMRRMFVGWLPGWLGPVANPASYAIMDDEVLAAFGYPKPSRFSRGCVNGALKARLGFFWG